MGAIVSTVISHQVDTSGRAVKKATLTFSASYATGGDTLDMANLGLRRVDQLFVDGGLATPGYHLQLAGTAAVPLIKLIKGATAPAEETNATNVSTVSAVVELHGFA